ncbi:AMP-binding protein [Gordonia sp. HNM0687]|uniref:AMP-binding protein n=1 Tax=Gordonia mangrovi TaxID=2665643 RepID=A0A6L7GXJ9_9ACTN|nr:acyl--CoA ligase family protein [Gordonia mangrovi]MXP24393.1 AMP-binding protein [Gordonia mangrovi]UVF79971.1 acyl--CoA ligase family protein [Gordonia mangrovi]
MTDQPAATPADFTFAPLTPVTFLSRAAAVFAERTAIIDGDRTFTYAEFHRRAAQLTAALADLGIQPGDRVAALCANSHVMLELHNAVPGSAAVLVPLNIRLSEAELAYILDHSGARLLVATHEFADTARSVAEAVGIRVVIAGGADDEYESLLSTDSAPEWRDVDERGLLAINYTSGTTGRPKGVMYHHRGAYLQSLAMAYHSGVGPGSNYLWTLPMFHCDGWCFTWALTAAGATHVCLRAIDTAQIWHHLTSDGITHFSAAPTVLTMIAEDPAAAPLEHTVQAATGGAPPSPSLLARMADLGIEVTHLYGLTETFGPIAVNQWQPEWDAGDPTERAILKARQGIGNISAGLLRVVTPNGADVPADAATEGELVARGNNVMLGYYRDPDATAAATVDGWLRTGDVAVMHPDGYAEIRDRSKDVIISGGENIASVEVERVLDSHPDVVESAVVARADDRWGEVPVAYVTVRRGADLGTDDLVAFARERLARFKVPKQIVFADLPKTSTGKIQKNVLRGRRGD